MKAKIAALVRVKLAIKESAAHWDGSETPFFQLTEAGKKAVEHGGQKSICYAKRKLLDITMYTLPAQQDGYFVVHVIYHWMPAEMASWTKTLLAEGVLGSDPNKDLSAPKSDAMISIATNKGWKSQNWFGNPIRSVEPR